jgi:hypothetical protein
MNFTQKLLISAYVILKKAVGSRPLDQIVKPDFVKICSRGSIKSARFSNYDRMKSFRRNARLKSQRYLLLS